LFCCYEQRTNITRNELGLWDQADNKHHVADEKSTRWDASRERSPKQRTRRAERRQIFELREISREEYERLKSLVL